MRGRYGRGETQDMGRLNKRELARSFGAAEDYAADARVQRDVAASLTTRLAAQPTPGRILEIGCGTGFLTLGLRRVFPEARLLASDLSLAMIRRCRAALGEQAPSLLVMDGERPALAGEFDLVVASLVFQWFDQPESSVAALAQRVAPGGLLAFATLGPETFASWREACRTAAVPCGLHHYPAPQRWGQWLGPTWQGQWSREFHGERHPSRLAFLRQLRRLGMDQPRADHRPTPRLGAVLRVPGTFDTAYDVIFGLYRRPVTPQASPSWRESS
ncbi:MAG: methyltransferase domain-containing protein [Magnetococcus sp. WYHC-3]